MGRSAAEDGGRAAILVRDGKVRVCAPPENSRVTAIAASRQPVSRTPLEEGRAWLGSWLWTMRAAPPDPPTPYRLSRSDRESGSDLARAAEGGSAVPMPMRRAVGDRR